MQELTDIIVIESLPLATCPFHTVFPAGRTFSSSVHVHQAAPHPTKHVQGLSISVAQSPLYKPWFPEESSVAIAFDLMTGIQYNVVIITDCTERQVLSIVRSPCISLQV